MRATRVLIEPVNESDHKPVLLDIGAATASGKSRLGEGIRQAQNGSDQRNNMQQELEA